MPKRFFETELWEKRWYRELSPAHKCFWHYLLLHCDLVGVWAPDIEKAEFCIGEKVDCKAFLSKINGNVVVLENGKWYVVDFVEFQNGDKVSEDSRSPVQQKIISLLKRHGLWGSYHDRVAYRVSDTVQNTVPDTVKEEVGVEVGVKEEDKVRNKKVPGGYKEFVDELFALCGGEYVFTAKDGQAVKRILAPLGKEDAIRRLRLYYQADHWFTKDGRSLQGFAQHVNELGNGKAEPKEKAKEKCPKCGEPLTGGFCTCGWYKGQSEKEEKDETDGPRVGVGDPELSAF